jgi:hypothetical protein
LFRITATSSVAIAALLLLAPLPAAAQTGAKGDSSRSARPAKDAPAGSGPETWDANHDGVNTCDEWKSYLDRMFVLADRNRDGNLDPSEFLTIRRVMPIFADADFAYFDENQDGKIGRREFVDKPSEFILQHDKNGDCRVTQDEMKDTGTEPKPAGGRGKKF